MSEQILLKFNGPSTIELSLSQQGLTSLMHLVKYIPLIQHVKDLPNLKMLDLSSNRIKNLLPPGIAPSALQSLKLNSLLSLNLSDNPLKDLKMTTDYIQVIMP